MRSQIEIKEALIDLFKQEQSIKEEIVSKINSNEDIAIDFFALKNIFIQIETIQWVLK